MSNDTLVILVQLLVTLALIALNALFVFHEFAFVTLKPGQVRRFEQQSSRINRLVARGVRQLDHYIAVDQLGITVTSIAVGWIGQPAVSQIFANVLSIALPQGLIPIISAAIAFILITAAQMIIGELMPKTVALRHPERTARNVAYPVEIFAKIFHPFVVVLNGLGMATVRLLGFKGSGESHTPVLPVEELVSVMESSAEAGVLTASPDVLRRMLQFSDLQAQDVMVPRQDVVGVAAQASVADVLSLARDTGHTRYPVYEGSIDNVVGLLNIKDLVELDSDGAPRIGTNWRRLVRPIPVLPETASIEQLINQLRQARQQLALLVDEYGGTAGIVSVSNIVQYLVGKPGEIQLVGERTYLLAGHVSVDTVENELEISLRDGDEDEYETIAGLVLQRRQDIPSIGDRVSSNGHQLTVVDMDGLRITEVRLEIEAPAGTGDTPEGTERS